ncbi:MAG: DNA-methyltransferase [Syntrophomonadaceae bacterium]
MEKMALPRLDKDEELCSMLLPYCRIKPGQIWKDPKGRHKIGCLDATDIESVYLLMENDKAVMAIHDPPYNIVAFGEMTPEEFVLWSKGWVNNTDCVLEDNSSLYIWLGADQKKHFQPFAEFILMMKETNFESRSFISMRNQRGYGTQKNWMAVRQELLYYIKGAPFFNINAVYTGIPKVLRGYYKKIKGRVTENLERSKSSFIRAGNIWIDIQQVFYRMEENVSGCYAQKPLKAIERIIQSGSRKNEIIIDFFSHSGTTLLASERTERKCFTIDINPVFCEVTLRRLERFRCLGKAGWQNSNPFAPEIIGNKIITDYLKNKYPAGQFM